MSNSPAAEAATRSHANVTLDRLHGGRLFLSPDENLAGLRAFLRFDVLLSEAETEGLYPRWLEGGVDGHDYIGQSVSAEVHGRSAEKWIEDYENGPEVRGHERVDPFRRPANDDYPAVDRQPVPLSQAGRFRFTPEGIICGYRLNREPHEEASRDVWVDPKHRKYPLNVVTPMVYPPKKGRSAPGKTQLHDTQGSAANDNFEARSTLEWLRSRMSPEHFEAAYDATAGQGFGEIGRAAGFGGKQAEAVGKDRVQCAIRTLVRLYAERDA